MLMCMLDSIVDWNRLVCYCIRDANRLYKHASCALVTWKFHMSMKLREIVDIEAWAWRLILKLCIGCRLCRCKQHSSSVT